MNYFQSALQSWIDMSEYWQHKIESSKKRKELKGDVE